MGKKKIILYTAGAATLLCVVFLPGYFRMHKLRKENEQYKKRIELLEEHNNKLKGELTRVHQDPEYIEKKAREKLGIIKKGEIIYRHKDD